jgi:hypothetical protein
MDPHLPARPRARMIGLCGCLLLFLFAGAACTPLGETPVSTHSAPTANPVPPATLTVTQAATRALVPTPTTPTTPLPPDFWKSLPVIPTALDPRVLEIYRHGLELGNHPRIFSRIGDCASAAPAFLVGFDGNYNLGEYAYLQPAIDYFHLSFKRPSLAAKAGLNTAGVLTTLWTGEQCQNHESLLDCQYRLDQPAFAIISLGTNEAYYVHRDPASFERNMRLILDDTIARGIVPILATKADNVEGDHSINATIARLALEYGLPLWNFWLAVQPLPDQGMVEPEHLNSVSYANFTDFSIPHSLEYGMQVRNLTALQMLHFLWGQLASVSSPEPTPSATPIP